MEKYFTNEEQKGNDSLWNKELWKQQEVADYFRVTSNTIKNWRERGLLSFFQAPGSSRIQYYRDEIRSFRNANSVLRVAFKAKPKNTLHKEKPVKSDILHNEDWRI
jgi:hypothetical protein